MSVMDQVAAGVATLELDSIYKFYGGVAALRGVSLRVMPGEVHAVLGENGAGKSTLMGVATGTVQPSQGTIAIQGQPVSSMRPDEALRLGIAIVHQHPAVLPDLTVLENLRIALPDSVLGGRTVRESARAMLKRVGLEAHLQDRVGSLTLAEKHLLEIAKAFALRPRLLVLDEPTAPLSSDSVRILFALVREAVADGMSVIYITHRMAEVRELADRVTVLRDGEVRGTSAVADITDNELLALIIGRELDSTFPPKHESEAAQAANLEVNHLSGTGFSDISFVACPGEIIGIAGVVGNGQSNLLRGLAGLDPTRGEVSVNGSRLTPRDLVRRSAYMPADRHTEGLIKSLTVRENAALSALSSFARGGFVSRSREVSSVRGSLQSLDLKAPSLDAAVGALSGGNQQKVVIARALLSEPALLLADEPTQGVDVGARAEIYSILRQASRDGVPVIVASSDAKELEGLCDRVLVMSRGQVVATLENEDVNEQRIVSAAVTSTNQAVHAAAVERRSRSTRFDRFLQGDYAPPALLVALMVVLGLIIAPGNDRYFSSFNVSNVLLGTTAIGLLALGQNVALMTGGIDLSVGPLAGFLVVVSSFYFNDGQSVGLGILGLVIMVALAAATGLINGCLIRYARFTPIAATLTLYIGLGGFAFLLRSTQGGYVRLGFQDAINFSAGPLPVAFVVFVVIAIGLEVMLRRTRWGWKLRAVGSDEVASKSIGVRVDRTVVGAYVLASLLVFLGALLFMAQYGIGDPSQGSAFTLTSVTAVVLGGTSLLGGRGTFLGTLAGAVLLQQVLNATIFLGLGSTSQYYFQGALIIAAAALYTLVRRHRRASKTGA